MTSVFVIGFLQPDLEGGGADVAESRRCWMTAVEGGIGDDDDRIGVGVIEGNGLPVVVNGELAVFRKSGTCIKDLSCLGCSGIAVVSSICGYISVDINSDGAGGVGVGVGSRSRESGVGVGSRSRESGVGVGNPSQSGESGSGSGVGVGVGNRS